MPSTRATSPASTSPSTITTPRIRDETRHCAEDIYGKLQGRRPDRDAHHRAVLRPGQADVPARPLHQGRVPEVRRQGPVRRQLRSLRRGLRADRPEEPVLGGLRRQAGAANPPTTTSSNSPIRAARSFLRRWTREAAGCRPKRPTRCRNGWARRAKTSSPTGTSRATRPTSASRFPATRRASTSTSGSMRRSATWVRSRTSAPRRASTSTSTGSTDSTGRAVPLHRQGHPLLPRAVLAGRAGARRLPHADQRLRARLPDRRRRQDVEVARHLHHRRKLPARRASIRNGCATTTPPS